MLTDDGDSSPYRWQVAECGASLFPPGRRAHNAVVDPAAPRRAAFVTLSLAFNINDEDFKTAESQVPGIIMLHLSSLTSHKI